MLVTLATRGQPATSAFPRALSDFQSALAHSSPGGIYMIHYHTHPHLYLVLPYDIYVFHAGGMTALALWCGCVGSVGCVVGYASLRDPVLSASRIL
jgi:hypothetical protein